MVELHLISTFLEIAKSKKLNVVAKKFNITQPALSYRIKMLEAQVGKNLFFRKKSGLELNGFGKELLAICRNLNRDVEKIDNWAV